jgi:hypothetical protein
VDSVFVVTIDIFAQQAMQAPFVHDDHVVQHLAASAPDPFLGNPTLPWGVAADQVPTSKRPSGEARFQCS